MGNDKLKNKVSIHVFGKMLEEDTELIKKLNLTVIIFEHERISYSMLTRYMKGADILCLSQGEDHSDCVPYKLTDYLTIGKPILAVTPLNSSTYNFMQEMDVGIAADIDNPDSIYNALKEILIDERQFSFSGIEKYSLNNIADIFMELLQISSNTKFMKIK
ncbi:MAG: hypothetical protein A2057_04725 [Ignavibacteria bacterium GWA2_35_9]|nr:MAG: hypothetical protein A2057_04725 [Ignavibacteria bacterium GWA2_35_9]OGU44754.1 MAG: hypothetical protein A2000_04490 [Ignavibacteria bacterium GWB2_36_8]OGU48736.1 MAG: hypothetical protein A2080_05840 [Ignavibacteria bacterium GWC2_36_12]